MLIDSLSLIIGIYCIRNKLNGRCYVGKSNNVYYRIGQHLTKYNSNKYLQIDMLNMGLENFSVEILEIVLNEKMLYEREAFFISKYRSKGIPLYNNLEASIIRGKIKKVKGSYDGY